MERLILAENGGDALSLSARPERLKPPHDIIA